MQSNCGWYLLYQNKDSLSLSPLPCIHDTDEHSKQMKSFNNSRSDKTPLLLLVSWRPPLSLHPADKTENLLENLRLVSHATMVLVTKRHLISITQMSHLIPLQL